MIGIKELYDSGITYLRYIEAAEQLDREKHLHYLRKMELDEAEKKLAASISKPVKLLVFCNISCSDCRIALAVLENISKANPLLQYRIADREGNRDIMRQVDKNCRIPLIIDTLEGKSRIVFNELPWTLQDRMSKQQPNESDILRQNYRKGLMKTEIFDQIINFLKKNEF